MSALRRCIGFNLAIQTELPLPGAVEARGEGATDITVLRGAVAGVAIPARFRRDGDAVVIDETPIVRFRCSREKIIVDALPGADPADVCARLIATALPAAIWQRREPVLHGSCFVPKGGVGAIGVCGPRGAGKSTLLAQIVAEGGQAVADDAIRIAMDDGVPVASGLPGVLWRKHAKGRQACPIPRGRTEVRAPLAAIFVMTPMEKGAPRFAAICGPEALAALLSRQHRPQVPALLGIKGDMLQSFARLAQRPVYSWQWTRQAPVLSGAEAAFLADVSRGEKAEWHE